MGPLVAVVVYWCLATAPLDSFNPHMVNAVKTFVAHNPATCHATLGEVLEDRSVDVDLCRRRQMFAYMPGWLQKPENAGKVYLGADCIAEKREPLDLQALKEHVTP